jgi:hypothetical protein
MARPNQPATATIKKIYDLLLDAPSYPTKIHDVTGLHGNTVNVALKFLFKKGLINKERKEHRVYYSLVIGHDGGGVPWVELMCPKEAEIAIRKEVTQQIRVIDFRKELGRRVLEMREKFSSLPKNPENEELVNILIQIGENSATAKVLLDNIKQPFCLECLADSKLFIPMKLVIDYDEFCCPNCGIAIPKPKNEVNRPIENSEQTKLMELFYKKESKEISYSKIERLLLKYKK